MAERAPRYLPSYANGMAAEELFMRNAGTGLTYDDLIIMPRFVERVPSEVDLRVDLARGIRTLPLISSPMDRITEWLAAVHMALNGCLGILHINLDEDEAVAQVRKVKRFQMGFVWEPVCLRPDRTVADARALKRQHGFSTVPITEDGTPRSRFLGMVTKNCIDFVDDDGLTLGQVMIPAGRLQSFSFSEVANLEHARDIFRADPQLAKLPILNPDGSVCALVNRGGIRNRRYPHALTDGNNQLRLGAAVTTHPDDDGRTRKLIEAGVDCLVIDSSQGGTGFMLERIRKIRAISPEIPIVAGNTATETQTAPLLAAGASAIRVGMGPGSICTTQGALRIGRAQGSAVYHAATGGATVIADGGIRQTGDMILALALGAKFVMVGRYIAGCEETPSPTVTHNNQRFKLYRGMGSIGAMTARAGGRYGRDDDTLLVAQGTDDQLVPVAGSLDKVLTETMAALRLGLAQLGCASIAELHEAVANDQIRFERRSEAAKAEGGLHDLVPIPGR